MRIEFDPAKDTINQRKYGVPLASASRIDIDAAVVISDDRHVYGESRFIAYGSIDGRLHSLVFTMRGDALRAISLRKANPREVTRYGRGC